MTSLRNMSMKDMLAAAKKKKGSPPPASSSITSDNSESSSAAASSSSNSMMQGGGYHNPASFNTEQQNGINVYNRLMFTPTANLLTQLPEPIHSYRLADAPATVYLIPDFITAQEESQMVALVDKSPTCMWTKLKRRRCQMWGGLPKPSSASASTEFQTTEPLPQWQEQIIDRIVHAIPELYPRPANLPAVVGAEPSATTSTSTSADSPSATAADIAAANVASPLRPNHVLLNEYEPGEGIMPHVDGPLYEPLVAILSMASHTVFHFYKELSQSLPSNHQPSLSIYVPPRSLFIFTHELYTSYYHAIEERSADELNPNSVRLVPQELRGQTVEREKRISLTIRKVRGSASAKSAQSTSSSSVAHHISHAAPHTFPYEHSSDSGTQIAFFKV